MDIAADPELSAILFGDAISAGVPLDQMANFGQAAYVPLAWSLPFHAAAREADREDGPVMIACGGARGPGKSHAIMAQVGLDDCQRAPGLKALFLRKVMKKAAESFDDLTRKVFRNVAKEITAGKVVFENGSRILIGGYNAERDIDNYLGIEYDVIVLEEGTQITGKKREKIRGSLRTSRRDWRARWYESSNPGGVGHLDFKNLYVIPLREKRQTETRFFPSTYRDNPWLHQEYINYLLGLTGALGKAWRDGDWDIFEGQAFPAWRHERHVCTPFDIPGHWTRYRGVDWGYRNPFACVWISKDPDIGRIYIYREVKQAGLTDRQQARALHDNSLPGEKFASTFADPSMWTKKSEEKRIFSTADEYAAEKIYLTKADNNRIIGKRKIDTLLADLPDGRPGLMVFETCVNWIEDVPALPYAESGNMEDVDSDADDHIYDGTRYALTAINPKPRLQPGEQLVNDPLAKHLRIGQGVLAGKDF